MKQSVNYTVNQCIAEITVKKNSIKKYNNDYYLKNGQEFEILLRNNTQDVVMATIKINGKQISTSGLVLKPGQKVYLERYLDQNRKFIFETYKVDNSTESLRAIENNGNIEVQFYKEKYNNNYGYVLPQPTYRNPYWYYADTSNQLIGGGLDTSNVFYSNNENLSNIVNTSYTTSSNAPTIKSLKSRVSLNSMDEVETGRVGQGSISNQSFKDYQGQFQSFSFKTIKLKILPHSLKPLETRDLAQYCVNCGTKNKKNNYKFCPKCGTRF